MHKGAEAVSMLGARTESPRGSRQQAAGGASAGVSPLVKYGTLMLLVLQTTALVLTLRYSRIQPVQGARYLNSTAILLGEFIKLLTCFVLVFRENGITSHPPTPMPSYSHRKYIHTQLL